MKQVTKLIDSVLAWFLIFLMATMVITVTWQVMTRYLLNSPSSYTEELATYLLIWISLLGAAYALRMKAHLGIDILVRNLKGAQKKLVHYLLYISVIVFAGLIFIFGGIRLVTITLKLKQLSAAFKMPVGYIYLVLPLSGVLMVYYSIVAIVEKREAQEGLDRKQAMIGAE